MTQYIFDTNFYRNQVSGKEIAKIKESLFNLKLKEKEKDFKILFSNIAAIELISNLLDKNRDTVDDYLNALKFMTRHTGEIIDGRWKGSIVPTFYDLLSVYFFQVHSKGQFVYNNNILTLSKDVGLENYTISQYKNHIQEVIDIKKNEVNQIIENIATNYVRTLNSQNELDWNIFPKDKQLRKDIDNMIQDKRMHKLIGLSFIRLAMQQVETNTCPVTKTDFENIFMKDFYLSIDFFVNKIYANLINLSKIQYFYEPDSDPKNRWNSFYGN